MCHKYQYYGNFVLLSAEPGPLHSGPLKDRKFGVSSRAHTHHTHRHLVCDREVAGVQRVRSQQEELMDNTQGSVPTRFPRAFWVLPTT